MTINFNGIEMNISSAELDRMLHEARKDDRNAIRNALTHTAQSSNQIAKKVNLPTSQVIGYLLAMGVHQGKVETTRRWAELDEKGNLTGTIKTETVKHTTWSL